MKTFPLTETTFLLPGPAGDLEILTAPPAKDAQKQKAIAIICHPHPLYSGTMNNKVVTTLSRVFTDLGLSTVRFNFRGVGKSAGTYGNAQGEIEDLFAVIQWVQAVCPDYELWLAGFSFGSYISAYAASQIPVAKLVSVAPPVTHFGFPNLPAISCPWIVVQGDLDDVVNPADVYEWMKTVKPAPALIRMSDAGHFFHGKLLELRKLLEAELMVD